MKQALSSVSLLMLPLGLALTSAAQVKAPISAGLYGSVPAAWAAPLRSLVSAPSSMGMGPMGFMSPPAVDPALGMAQMAPIAMALEAKGISPESFSSMSGDARLQHFQAALVSSEEMVQAEARSLVAKIAADPEPDALPGIAAKMYMLENSLGVFLPAEQREPVKAAYERVYSSLSSSQRAKVDAALRRTAAALGGLTAVESAAGGGVRTGEADPDSFARRHALLGKPVAQARADAPRVPEDSVDPTAGDAREAKDRSYSARFATIPGVSSVELLPHVVPVPGSPRTRYTTVYVNFGDEASLQAARRSGALPALGYLRGYFTGYHIVARLAPEVAARARRAVDESYRARFAAIPGVSSVDVLPSVVPVPGTPRTRYTTVYVNFRDESSLRAARQAGLLPYLGDLRRDLTAYRVVARVGDASPR